jgi:hypothetical protein
MSCTSVVTQTTTAWTEVPNATFPSSVFGGEGEPIGLLMALTYATTSSVTGQPWTSIATQGSGGWTSVITQNL